MPVADFTCPDRIQFGPTSIVEVDLLGDGVTWDAVESYAREIASSGGDYPTEQFNTFTLSCVSLGDQNDWQITLTYAYTQQTDNLVLQAFARLGQSFDIRWAPDGYAVAGDVRWVTSGGFLTAHPPPTGSRDDTTSLTVTLTVTAPTLSTEVFGP